VAALTANLAIAVAKLAGFLVTGSSSMLAESIHSVADSGNQGLLLLGRRRSLRPADDDHPFGHGRERYISAFLVAIVLFSVGGLVSVYEGVEKLRHPHHLTDGAVALAVLAVAAVAEAMSFRTALGESRPDARRAGGWWAFIRRTRSPELPTVLLEDFAALIGLALALAGIGISMALDEPRADGAATLAIGLLLLAVAVVLGVETHGMLVGEAASPEQVARIRTALESSPLVTSVLSLRTLHLGPDELLVAARIALPEALTMPAVAQAIADARVRLHTALPTAHRIYLEPDLQPGLPASTAADDGRPITTRG
jgi:cation diffusion facilitator family transporter